MRPRALPSSLLLLALALVATPGAVACSFAGEGPLPPGAFVLVDMVDGTEYQIQVEARGLGGTCELSNPVAVDGGYVAWLDGPRDARRLRLQDVHASDPVVDMPIVAEPFSISLFDRSVVIPERERIRVVDLTTGAEREVPRPREGSYALGKHLVAYQDGFGSGATLSVYDARSNDWRVRDRAMPELGERWWPWHVSDGWVVLHSEPETGGARYHALDLVTRELLELPLPSFTTTWALEGDDLYFQATLDAAREPRLEGIVRMRLPEARAEPVLSPVPYGASLTDGLLLFRAYSLQDHRTPALTFYGADETQPTPAPREAWEATPSPASPTPPASSTPSGSPTPPIRLVPGAAPLAALLLAAVGSAGAERWRKAFGRGR